jgi:hypothetical protein
MDKQTKEAFMAKQLELTSLLSLESGGFQATGTVDGAKFLAETVVYRGEPIFKMLEWRSETNSEDAELGHYRMTESRFNRGTRIAVARFLKAARLKAQAKPELDGLTLKELRSKARELGVTGTHRRGITKVEVLDLVRAAA